MTKQDSTQKDSCIRQLVPCLLALAIFVIPTLITIIVLPIAGPVIAAIAGGIVFIIILAICIIIWWVERPQNN